MLLASTRGGCPPVDVPAAILTGLAPDGGLYVPVQWPRLELSELSDLDENMNFAEAAARVMEPFTGELLDPDQLREESARVYARFDHPQVAPLVPLPLPARFNREDAPAFYLMELFWGPTLAFKDFALQMLGVLMDRALQQRGGRATIIGATSGDTGSAAMEAFRDRERTEVVILFPQGRTSEVQRRQMTTIPSPNVHAVAVEGTFDDCQDLCKRALADPHLRDAYSLTTANSINFGRLLAQAAYYYWAALRVGAPLTLAVPSGNFGNVYSGYAARRMGLEVRRLIVGSNSNRSLDGFFRERMLTLGEVVPTLSPSMDIQIPSNLERLLYDLYRGDGPRLRAAMEELRAAGRLRSPGGEALNGFASRWYDDRDTLRIMAETYQAGGPILDPHTAIGVGAARDAVGQSGGEGPVVCLGTAHPAKFPEAVREALGTEPPLPERLSGIGDLPERVIPLRADFGELTEVLREVGARAG